MNPKSFHDNEIPCFSWDRALTAGAIGERLGSLAGTEWHRLAAWIMREARFADVWQFLRPKEVRDRFAGIAPLIGRKREFWKYILDAWHELGKI